MEYFRNLSDYRSEKPTVITLGKFDGVHLGHRMLLEQVREIADRRSLTSVVFTFDAPPQAKIHHRAGKMLMTNEERRLLLSEEAMDVLIECPFTKEFRELSPDDFVRKILIGKFHAEALVVGDDFRFGKDRKGDAAFLEEAGRRCGFTVSVIGKKRDDVTGREISSTWVREELLRGNMETVKRLLGRPYFITGEIMHGRQIGRSIGIPTINQIPHEEKMLPPRGVYFSFAVIGAQRYRGVTNIGVRPTVSGSGVTAETNLLNGDGDLYGREARVYLLHFERPEQKFSSVDELKKKIQGDIAAAKRYVPDCVISE